MKAKAKIAKSTSSLGAKVQAFIKKPGKKPLPLVGTPILIFRSNSSGATYLWNGSKTICILPPPPEHINPNDPRGVDRKLFDRHRQPGKIMKGISNDVCQEAFDTNAKHFTIDVLSPLRMAPYFYEVLHKFTINK